jgi:hypothetical protein
VKLKEKGPDLRGAWHGRVRTALVAAACGVAVFVVVGGAAATPGERPRPPSGSADKHPKLASTLVAVMRVYRARGSARALEEARARGLYVVAGRIRVVIEARTGRLAGACAAVRAAGGVIEGKHRNLVQALIGPGLLEKVARSADVRYIRPPLPRTPGPAS